LKFSNFLLDETRFHSFTVVGELGRLTTILTTRRPRWYT
jgi:hypothetical protein